MAAGSVTRILRIPGRLVINPTSLAVAYPYGGTEVGYVNRVAVQNLGAGFQVKSELLGEPTDILESGNRYLAACFLRGFDDDAVELLFSDHHSTGSVSGHANLSVPGNNKPGASALDRAKRILYVPDGLLDAPALLIHRGVPGWPETGEVAFQRGEEFGFPLTIDCVRTTNGNILDIAPFADLTLDLS